MGINKVQFLKSLSIVQGMERYRTAARIHAWVVALRAPDGHSSPERDATQERVVIKGGLASVKLYPFFVADAFLNIRRSPLQAHMTPSILPNAPSTPLAILPRSSIDSGSISICHPNWSICSSHP